MSFKRIFVLLAILIFASSASIAFAERCPMGEKKGQKGEHKAHRMGMMKEKMGDIDEKVKKWTKELKLTEQQGAKIKEILTKSREEIKKIFEETKEKAMRLKAKAHDEIQALLTPEQKEKFKDIRKKHETCPDTKDCVCN